MNDVQDARHDKWPDDPGGRKRGVLHAYRTVVALLERHAGQAPITAALVERVGGSVVPAPPSAVRASAEIGLRPTPAAIHRRRLGAAGIATALLLTAGSATYAGSYRARSTPSVATTPQRPTVSDLASSAQIAVGRNPPAGGNPAVEWAGFAGNAQHTAVASVLPQPFKRIRWRAKVDRSPYMQGQIVANYGSPMITAANTVLVPTRISAKAGFRVIAYSGANGAQRWSLDTDYRPSVFANAAHERHARAAGCPDAQRNAVGRWCGRHDSDARARRPAARPGAAAGVLRGSSVDGAPVRVRQGGADHHAADRGT